MCLPRITGWGSGLPGFGEQVYTCVDRNGRQRVGGRPLVALFESRRCIDAVWGYESGEFVPGFTGRGGHPERVERQTMDTGSRGVTAVLAPVSRQRRDRRGGGLTARPGFGRFSNREPWRELIPGPTVHPDLSTLASPSQP